MGGKKDVCESCHGYSHRGTMLKLFVALATAFFIYMIGVGMGVAAGKKTNQMALGTRGGYYSQGMMVGGGSIMMNRVAGMLQQNKTIRLFGTVLRVEGNNIVILDNSNTEQVVVSQISTVINDGEKEVGLSSLTKNDDVVIYGVPSQGNQITAKLIQIQ